MKTLPSLLAVATSLAILGGCASTDSTTGDDAALRSKLSQAEERAEQNEAEARRLRTQLASINNGSNDTGMMSASSDLLPPNAQPGHCYARVLIPAQYQMGTETVLARAASERIDVTPARYEFVEETVLVQEESTRLEVIPATYTTVTERILIEPEKTIIREIPAEFDTVSEKILVKPAYTTWKKGRGPMERLDASTGEIMCLVEVPAEYKTVTKKVVRTPARTVEEVIPAQYDTVTRRVVDVPSSTREIVIPAQYDTVKVRKLVSAATTNTVEIPAEYKNVDTRKLVQDSRLEWREILCETNTSPGVIGRLQSALNAAGYDAGAADGIMGKRTLQAVKSYQRDNNLASGQLTLQVLEKLDVTL